MSREYFYGQMLAASRKRIVKPSPTAERRGVPATGRIVKLLVGHGHGFIRLTDDREIFFHRADVQEGTSINDFELGDTVLFDLLEDTVSGARALCVRRPGAV